MAYAPAPRERALVGAPAAPAPDFHIPEDFHEAMGMRQSAWKSVRFLVQVNVECCWRRKCWDHHKSVSVCVTQTSRLDSKKSTYHRKISCGKAQALERSSGTRSLWFLGSKIIWIKIDQPTRWLGLWFCMACLGAPVFDYKCIRRLWFSMKPSVYYPRIPHYLDHHLLPVL